MNDDSGSNYGGQTRPFNEVPARVRAKEVPSMNCPIDGTPLQMADRQGIEVDYCPACRGVWLDRGELDKIIERSATQVPAAGAAGGYPAQNEPYQRYEDQERREGYERQGGYDQSGHHGQESGRKKKRGSFLGDLFDFD